MVTRDEARRIVRDALSKELGDATGREEIEKACEQIALRIFDKLEPRQLRLFEELVWESAVFRREVLERLHEVNARLDSSQRPICRLRGEDAEGMPIQLIVGGGPSRQAQQAGKRAANQSLGEWLEDADEVIVVDPYLFKRSQEEGETEDLRNQKDQEHADELLRVVSRVQHAQFIYKGNAERGKGAVKISPGIANRIEAGIAERRIRATFNVVEDLHDRVWLKRSRGTWYARAIGTSQDGIGRRPTYILDMDEENCREYKKYVDHLVRLAQQSHERPINFKAKGR